MGPYWSIISIHLIVSGFAGASSPAVVVSNRTTGEGHHIEGHHIARDHRNIFDWDRRSIVGCDCRGARKVILTNVGDEATPIARFRCGRPPHCTTAWHS